jgi:large subunit ribosomal protein L25
VFRAFLRGHERVVKIKSSQAKTSEEYLLKDVQYDYLGEDIQHVDFIRFDASTRTVINVSLEFVGTPEGTKSGGVLDTTIKELHLEMSPKDAPESIVIRVMNMKLDDVLKIKDIPLPKGAKLSGHRLEDIVAQVKLGQEEEESTEIGEASMPEVIKRKDDKEGEDDE